MVCFPQGARIGNEFTSRGGGDRTLLYQGLRTIRANANIRRKGADVRSGQEYGWTRAPADARRTFAVHPTGRECLADAPEGEDVVVRDRSSNVCVAV